MTDIIVKTLPTRIPTKVQGVYYKEVQQTTIDTKGHITTKIIDKVFIIRYRDNGKQRLVTMGKYSEGIREAYCKAKRNEFLSLAKNGELPPQILQRKKKQVVTLNDLAKVYFRDKDDENKANFKQLQRFNVYFGEIEPSEINIKYAENDISDPMKGIERLGSKDINLLTKEQIIKLRKSLIDHGKAPKTINGVISLLKAIINYSIKEKGLKLINPVVGISKLKEDDNRERFLSIDEVKLLLKEVSDDELISLFVKLALTTGARLEAVLQIQKKDISLEHNNITLKDLKSGSTYMGFFDDDLKVFLQDQLRHLKANDYVVGNKSTATSSRTIQNRLKPVLDRLFNQGLDIRDAKNRVVIHTLRHTFASQLAIKSVPIFTIQKLMNHADISMTMRYAKLAPDSGRDVVKGLYN